MIRRFGLWAAILALTAGLWQLAAGLYIPAKAALAQVLIARAWAGQLAGDQDAAPWPWADTRPVAKIKVPRLALERFVLSGANGRTLAFAPGHQDGTALPGAPGVAIVAGHRDTHMAFLKQLRLGDDIEVSDLEGRTARYRVDFMRVVHKDRARVQLDVDGRRLVLVTCYPFAALNPGGPLRYVVMATAD